MGGGRSGGTQLAAALLGACLHCLRREDPLRHDGGRPAGEGLLVHADTAGAAACAVASLNFHAGALYLEEHLAISERVRAAKPAAGAAVAAVVAADGSVFAAPRGPQHVWRQLSRLYGMMGDSDVLLGLAEKVRPSPIYTLTRPYLATI